MTDDENVVVQTVRALTLTVQVRAYVDGRRTARVVLEESLGDVYPLTKDYRTDAEAVAALTQALRELTHYEPAE